MESPLGHALLQAVQQKQQQQCAPAPQLQQGQQQQQQQGQQGQQHALAMQMMLEHHSLRQRLRSAFAAIQARFFAPGRSGSSSSVGSSTNSVALVQAWLPVPQPPHQQQQNQQPPPAAARRIFCDAELCLLGDPALGAFRLRSCSSGVQPGGGGMPGRALRSGCVQVVQSLAIVPPVLHPRSAMQASAAAAGAVGELVYIPVFDATRPHAGTVAVLEALLHARAASMLVADFISAAGAVLSAVQLSLSSPLPQPVLRSRLEGRKPRPVRHEADDGSDSDDDGGNNSGGDSSGGGDAKQQQQAAPRPPLPPPGTPRAACDVAVPTASELRNEAAAAAATSAAAAAAAAAATAAAAAADVSCSAASTATATGCAAAACRLADLERQQSSTLRSTLSSRPRDASAAMPPPAAQLRGGAGGATAAPSSGPGSSDEDDEDGSGGAADATAFTRPQKQMRRSLSISRTKSVAGGLDQVFAAAAAAVATAAQQ